MPINCQLYSLGNLINKLYQVYIIMIQTKISIIIIIVLCLILVMEVACIKIDSSNVSVDNKLVVQLDKEQPLQKQDEKNQNQSFDEQKNFNQENSTQQKEVNLIQSGLSSQQSNLQKDTFNNDKGNSNQLFSHQFRQMSPIQYLQNVLIFDTIVYFLHCDKVVGFWSLYQNTLNIIKNQTYSNRSKNYSSEHYNECNLSHKEQDSSNKDKNKCLVCEKQFKNSTYLSLHYLVSHYNITAIEKGEQQQLLIWILNQWPYSSLNHYQFNTLFSQFVPQHQIFAHCHSLLHQSVNQQNVSHLDAQPGQHPSRYRIFRQQNNKQQYEQVVDQICQIISTKMYRTSLWMRFGKFVGLLAILIAFVCFCSGQCTENQRPTIQDNKNKKFKYY